MSSEQTLHPERYIPAAWQLAAESLPDLEQMVTAEQAAFLGKIAIRGTAPEVVVQDVAHTATLHHAAQEASLGNKQARDMIESNVHKDVVERLFKSKHQSTITLDVRDGIFYQHDVAIRDVHRNTLQHAHLTAPMLRRTKQEAKNFLRFEALQRSGLLETHAALIFSPAPTDMTTEEKQQYFFFTETETCSVQLLMANNTTATLETALVAGKTSEAGERQDIATIQALAASYGISITSGDSTEILGSVLLVPKESIPNGISDVVRQYDALNGGTFYGLDQPSQDYVAYAAACRQLEADFDDIVQQITDKLIAEAHMFATPMDAVKRLNALSEAHCLFRAFDDTRVDARVFGSTAALHLEEARFFLQQGEQERAADSLRKAQQTAVSGSCPLFDGERSDQDGKGPSDAEAGRKKLGKCPLCDATVFVDPCGSVLSCGDCFALAINGKMAQKGIGGKRARAAQRAQRIADRAAHQREQQEAAAAAREAAANREEHHITVVQSAGQLALATAS